MAPDIPTLRRDFPTLAQIVNGHPLVYLDNAATTQKPQPVLDALNHYYRDTNANVHRASHALSGQATRAFEAARGKVARFINAPAPEQVIWTRGTTEAINLVAYSFGMHHLQAGDEILLSTLEHHANIVPWQQVAAATGAVIRVIPLTASAELDLDAAARLISSRTRLLAVGQVSNALGV
ncbi:MAG: aminotransferase class V-fold PLP-dependent enzyme, partial [Oceanisphaera sp.]|nr:aminotransferase class V-fold PLP-dependent enzyme [Oceanisphaera sp.]